MQPLRCKGFLLFWMLLDCAPAADKIPTCVAKCRPVFPLWLYETVRDFPLSQGFPASAVFPRLYAAAYALPVGSQQRLQLPQLRQHPLPALPGGVGP